MKQLRTNNKTTSKSRKNKTLCSFPLRKSVILVKKIYPFCLPNKTIVCCLNNQYEINLKDFLNNKVFILVSSGIFNTCNIRNQNRACFCPSGMKSFLFLTSCYSLLRTSKRRWNSGNFFGRMARPERAVVRYRRQTAVLHKCTVIGDGKSWTG